MVHATTYRACSIGASHKGSELRSKSKQYVILKCGDSPPVHN